jgi:hypothetical protein
VVAGAVVGTTVADEAPELDMAGTRLLELILLRRGYKWEVVERGLNTWRRGGGAVLGAGC